MHTLYINVCFLTFVMRFLSFAKNMKIMRFEIGIVMICFGVGFGSWVVVYSGWLILIENVCTLSSYQRFDVCFFYFCKSVFSS